VGGAWRDTWEAVAGLGVTALGVPEAHGGFGLAVDAAAAVAMELGGALHGSPFAALTASAHALAHADDAAAGELLADLLAGVRTCTYGELDRAGTARSVDGAPEADALLLVDAAAGDLVLFTDPSSWTVDVRNHAFDVSRTCGDVTVDVARGRRLPADPVARHLRGVLLAADAVGCVRRMLDRTVRYAGQRQTFGRPIGGYQAVQHRLVDHAITARGMALAVEEAARLLAAGSPGAARAVVLAEVAVSGGAVPVLHDLLQLTGGIGFTWEYGLHLSERRAHQDARLAGNPRAAVRSLAALEDWSRAG
jgi:alkylation response protein AidB-like acyl-CoA dehydrogenase